MPLAPAPPLLFRNARQVLTLAGPSVPRRGSALRELGIIPDGAVLTSGSKIVTVGRTSEVTSTARCLAARDIDCRGRVVIPGFVDSHTHLVFAGSRIDDFEKRIRGKTYQEIAQEGGGIGLSARLLRQASLGDLVVQARRFLREFAAHGTTTLEVKSGYGLDIGQELKILEATRRLRQSTPLELVPTLLAAHALPPRYKNRRTAYLDAVKRRLIPTVAKRRLAEFIDVFCDRVGFNVADCGALLAAGRQQGLKPRLHAEQFAHTGAAKLAVAVEAASADHLDYLKDSDVLALAHSNVVATLLPGANFHLHLAHYPPARKLIDMGAAVALATDFNPGTCPTLNMQFILSLACSAMSMTPAEAIAATTINAAYALRRHDRLGSLEPGKQADLIVMDLDDYRKIPYYFAWNHCVMTVKRGRIIYAHE